MSISPLTGEPLAKEPIWQDDIFYYHDDQLGRYAITSYLLHAGFTSGQSIDTKSRKIGEKQSRSVLALATSKTVEAWLSEVKPPMFYANEETEFIRARIERVTLNEFAWRPITVETLFEESVSLTLEDKAYRTIANLALAEDDIGMGIPLAYSMHPLPGRLLNRSEKVCPVRGVAYGCTDSEISVVFQLLFNRGYLREGDVTADSTKVFITPEGYTTVDSIHAGNPVMLGPAFLICRFNDDINAIFEAVYEKVGTDGKVPIRIQRVCDIHHVDKIDDRIIAEIKKAPIVVVDLTDHNFNVAFEAGFALSLNKPIVWTMQKQADGLKLPFDIQSHNVLIYEPNKLGQFKEQLEFRILAALSKSQEQSRWSS